MQPEQAVPNPSYVGPDVELERRESVILNVPSSGYTTSINTKPRTPEHAIERFDGEIDYVNARHVHRAKCDESCLNFWMVMVVMVGIIITSATMLVMRGVNVGENFWENLLTFSIGVLIPGPKYKKK